MTAATVMLAAVLAHRPAASIADVVAIMTAIDAQLPDADGLKWFNRLYLNVTRAVQRAGEGSGFLDGPFIAVLDVVFANLYFDAVAAGDANPASAPPAWRPLFLTRHTSGLARIQFALAGMNAHINRDLPDALVQTCLARSLVLADPSPQHDDFERVNAILEAVEEQAKPELAVGLVGDIDRMAGRLDDVLAMWSIRAARDAAWTHGRVLWQLAPKPLLRDAFFQSLDRFTGFAGRGLLVPVV